MIISRSPFRITLGGGGTDMPKFYKKHGSFFISAAINKHIYVCLKKNLLEKKIRCQYLETEIVDKVEDLKHTRARECLKTFGIENGHEIASVADLPAGSGLGSSGSYMVALLTALRKMYPENPRNNLPLPELAFQIEHDILGEPVGKQDQYIAYTGGIKEFRIDRDGKVTYNNLPIPDLRDFYNHCRIYFTNTTRDASEILQVQHKNKPSVEGCLLEIKDIGFKSAEALVNGNFGDFGMLLHDHWSTKKRISEKMQVNNIEKLYQELHAEKKVLGGKIIGAGGGGFMMLYIPKNVDQIDKIMLQNSFIRVPFEFDNSGCKILGDK